jgi:small subunit ribosomal protein S3Ae
VGNKTIANGILGDYKMAKAKQKKQTVKTVKKKWYEIQSQGYFQNKLGESLLDDPQKLVGRKMKVNLMDLTNNVRMQQITLKYVVEKLEGDKGMAVWKDYEMSPTFLKRMIRRRTTRIDSSFIARTQDNQLIRIKPMVIARNNLSTPLRSEIRKATIQFFAEKIMGLQQHEVLGAVISGGMQKELKKKLSTYAPIKSVEVRVIRTVASGRPISLEAISSKGGSVKKITKLTKKLKREMKKGEAQEDELDEEFDDDLEEELIEDDSDEIEEFDESDEEKKSGEEDDTDEPADAEQDDSDDEKK